MEENRNEGEGVRIKHDFESSVSLSTDVVLSVAAVVDTDPRDMPPLDRIVNPYALDMLFPDPSKQDASESTLVFTYADCEVTVSNDGEITIQRIRNG